MSHKHLVVPDVHEEYDKLVKLTTYFEQFPLVTFLGDWFDTFNSPYHKETAQWVKDHLNHDGWCFLLGNHDCHYAFRHQGFLCSGYSGEKWQDLKDILKEEDWRKFKIFSHAGLYLLSHAGVRPDTKHLIDEEQEALDAAFAGAFHRLFAPGFSRGGHKGTIGGPTWMDWHWEFDPIKSIPQIVGHTYSQELKPRVKLPCSQCKPSWCIDTGLNHLAIVEENLVKIVSVDDIINPNNELFGEGD